MNGLRILLVGRICNDEFEWTIAPSYVPQVSSENPDVNFDEPASMSFFDHLMPVDGELMRLIDEGEQTQELIDAREDEEWNRGGQW